MEASAPTGLEYFDDKLLEGLSFCTAAYQLFESVRVSDGGVSRLRLRGANMLEKKLVEELLPIAKYVQLHYRPGRYISVRWKAGSQSGDAEIEQRGLYVDQGYFPAQSFVEVTTACHQNEYLLRERLEKNGGCFGVGGLSRRADRSIHSEPTSHSNQDYVDAFTSFVEGALLKKAKIPYPENTILIIVCELNNLYLPDDWQLLLQKVRSRSVKHTFEAVFLHDATADRFDRL